MQISSVHDSCLILLNRIVAETIGEYQIKAIADGSQSEVTYELAVLTVSNSNCLQAGGPQWAVPTGRRDSTVSLAATANSLPSQTMTVAQASQSFASIGLSPQDLVILLGEILITNEKSCENCFFLSCPISSIRYVHENCLS